MGKKKKDPAIEDYEKVKNEMIIDKVDEVFRTQPDNYIFMNLTIFSAFSSPITHRPVWTRKI